MKTKFRTTQKGISILLSSLALLFLTVGLYGCSKKPTATPAPAPTATVAKAAPAMSAAVAITPAMKATALKLIAANGCQGCHMINGKGGSIGPNLSKEGTKGHSMHWMEVQINTPKVHNPKTMMPSHNLNKSQLTALATYLESLK